MKILNAKSRSELVQKIHETLNPNTQEVYIDIRPSIQIIIILLNKAPNLKTLYVPNSLYRETSERVKNALYKIGVQVLPLDRPRGRPRTHDKEKLEMTLKLAQQGESAKTIASKTGLPLRTVYYHIKKGATWQAN